MPKVIKSGIFSPEFEIPEVPPPGLVATCKFCRAELETTKEEKKYTFSKKIFKGVLFVGWNIKCPECGKGVFFVNTKISSETLGKINGYG